MIAHATKGRVLGFLALLALCAGLAGAAELGRGELPIRGTRLLVSPEAQTVPFDFPTLVTTELEGFDSTSGELPPGFRVLGDLEGPEIDGVLVLETQPGEPFRIPALRLKGEYTLSNIRLLDGEQLVSYGSPRDSVIRVDQVLVTRVTSRPLTLDEIRSYGIVVDEDNFQAFNFTFGFGLEGDTVDYNVPVFFTPNGGEGFSEAVLLGEASAFHPRFQPPQMAMFQLNITEGDVTSGGCDSPFGDCFVDPPPPLPGVLLFPTDLGLLNQFFSVVLLAGNGAPAGDPLVIRDLTAKIRLPGGLRQAETEPPTPLGVPVPVRVPGPDGELGTADDLSFLVAQATGEAEFLVEGLREGTHVVSIDLEGVLDGLPGGIRRIAGLARGVVVVRDPTFGITISHPEVVRADEEYTLGLTIANTSGTPANLVTISLPLAGLVGAEVIGPRQHTIDTLLPGDSELIEFRLRALRTGKVVAAAARSTAQIHPTFELTAGVGQAGIPLSPTSIVLPAAVSALPEAVRRNAQGLVGLGFSLATAPPSLLSAELPRLTRSRVDERVYQLAQAARAVRFGEDLFEAVVVLGAEWTGSRDGDLDWDRLRRITDKGARFGHAVSQVVMAEAEATSEEMAFDRFAAAISFLPPSVLVMANGAGLKLEVRSLANGQTVEGSGIAADRARELAFADLYPLGQAELALLTRPESSGYRATVTATAGGSTGELVLLVPASSGPPRKATFSSFSLASSGRAWVEFAPGAGGFTLFVDANGDGVAESQHAAALESVPPRPFEVVGAVQNADVDPTGHIVEVLFSADVDLSSLTPRDPERFTIPGKVSNGGLLAGEAATVATAQGGVTNPFAGLTNTRLVRVVFDNPLSPYVSQLLTVRDLSSAAGEPLGEQTVTVTTTVATPGTLVAGRVIGADGATVPFARVKLVESDPCPLCLEEVCVAHTTAAVNADENGEFFFDYVRQTSCGEPFVLSATDPDTQDKGSARGAVRFIGETVNLDVVMVGRGTLRGRVLYDDGTPPPEGTTVQVLSPAFREGRQVATDSNGNFQAGELPVGTLTVVVRDPAGNLATATALMPVAGAVVERNLVIVRRSAAVYGEVRGRVLAAQGGSPVSDAWVALYHADVLVGVRRSGADGGFDFGAVEAGQCELEVFSGETGRSGARVFFEVSADQTRFVDVLLVDERGSVEGFIRRQTLSGTTEPVAMAVVWAGGTPANTRSDSSGFYRLEGVLAGTLSIQAFDETTGQETRGLATVFDGQTTARDLTFTAPTNSGGIAGEVLGYDGTPVPFATVHREVNDQQWQGEAITDSAGRFVLSGVGPGTHRVHAIRGVDGGVATATVRFAGDTPFVTIRFARGTVRGQVLARNESGQLVGVPSILRHRLSVVRLGLVGPALEPTDIETDNDGRFELSNVLAGRYTLTAFNALHGEKHLQGSLAQNGEVIEHQLIFESAGVVAGTVYGIDEVTPVAGARVYLRHPAVSGLETVTDALGKFRFELVAPYPRRYPLEVSFEDGMVLRLARVWVALDRPGLTVTADVVLPKQGAVSGRVEDANGNLVPAAQVTLRESDYPGRELNVTADANGAFAFRNVFVGPLALSARSLALGGLGGRAELVLSEEGEEKTGVVIRLQDTGEIRARVLSPVDLSPLPSAEVRIYRQGSLVEALSSNGDGEALFELLPLGTYELRAFDPGSGRAGSLLGLTLSTNGQRLDRDLVLETRGTVEGRLFEPGSSLGVAGATVRLESDAVVNLLTYSSTDLEGAFQFDGVGQGLFFLTAQEPQGRRRASAQGEIVTENETVVRDLVLEASGSVVGSVRAPTGAPEGLFSPANVVLRQDGIVVDAVTDSTYRLEGAIAGRGFVVEASEPGGSHRGEARGTLESEGQELPLDVRMVAIGSVTVAVLDQAGNPVPGVDVHLTTNGFYGRGNFAAGTGADHLVSFPNIGAGAVSAFVTDPATQLKGSASGTLSLEGEVLALTVRLEPSGEVRGALLLADGVTPAAGALAVLGINGVTYSVVADAAGVYHFPALPLGAFTVQFTENLGPGVGRIVSRVNFNNEVVDLGLLVLDAADPRVLSISPAPGAVGANIGEPVVIHFSEPIDAAVFGPFSVIVRPLGGGGDLGLIASFGDGGATVTLTPIAPLASFTSYQIRINTEIRDLAWRRLPAAIQTTFTTRDAIPPQVTLVSPANGAVQVPLSTQIRLEFSEPLAEASLSGSSLQLTDLTTGLGVATTFVLDAAQRVVSIEVAEPLASEHSYRLVVFGVTDLSGNGLTAPFVSTFRTVDITAPQVSLSVPAGPLYEGVSYLLVASPLASPDLAAVSFFAGNRLLATDEAAPFELAYVPNADDAAAGTVVLSAVGRDSSGNLGPAATASRETVPDLPPQVSVTVTPTAEILPGRTLRVDITSSDSSGLAEVRILLTGAVTATSVNPFQGETSTSLSFSRAVPFTPTASFVDVVVRATDRVGKVTQTAPHRLQVFQDTVAPLIGTVLPAAGSSYFPGETVVTSAVVTDVVSVDRVRFSFAGTVRDDFSFPYQATFTAPAVTMPTNFDLVVEAQDPAGNVSTLTRVVVVSPDVTAPVLANVLPADGAVFTAGLPFAASAEASDNLAVDRVVFTLGTESFTDTQPPYRWDRLAPEVAVNTAVDLTVEAFDVAGNRAVVVRALTIEALFDPTVPASQFICSLAGGLLEGDLVLAGRTARLAFTVSDDELVESYRLFVNGALLAENLAVNQPSGSFGVDWTVPAGALPGDSFLFSLEVTDYAGNTVTTEATVTVAGGAVLSTSQPLGASFNGQDLRLATGTFTVTEALELSSLVLLDGARLVGESGETLAISTTGELVVQCGTTVDATGLGYAGGTAASRAGKAPAGVAASQPDAGGSHGGVGDLGLRVGPAGAVYDSVYHPSLGGGGGARDTGATASFPAGAGGGVVMLQAQELVVHGRLLANGVGFASGPTVRGLGGGAGGSIVVEAERLTGGGRIEASGGDALPDVNAGGAGGGGRVAIYAQEVEGFEVASQARAWGGKGLSGSPLYGAPGTVYVATSASTFGTLRIDSGSEAGLDRLGRVTTLPALGSGLLTSFDLEGPDAWIGRSGAFTVDWLGAWVVLTNGGGAELGAFRVLELDVAGRLKLAGAAAVSGAVNFRGEYRFDHLELAHGAGFAVSDPTRLDLVSSAGGGSLSGPVTAPELKVQAGAALALSAGSAFEVITVESGGTLTADATGELVLEAETITVVAGGAIDVSGKGFAGGTASHPAGFAPAGVAASQVDAGGSHGGVGDLGIRVGPAGAVYDSVYVPSLGGGGGARDAGASTGAVSGAGGGVLVLRAGQLVVDGEVRANGMGFVGGSAFRGLAGGAGGSVVLEVNRLAGAGRIEASGGDALPDVNAGGAGGGGRVAIDAQLLDGFDPAAQVRAWGGKGLTGSPLYGAPGTLLLRTPASTYGALVLDSGTESGANRLGPVTDLPALGSGGVVSLTADGADAWLARATTFGREWAGVWVALEDAAGAPLGDFEVVGSDPAGRLRLAGAASVSGASRYRGVYRFDSIDLRHGAGLGAVDPVAAADLLLAHGARLSGPVTAPELTVPAGTSLALGGSFSLDRFAAESGATILGISRQTLDFSVDTFILESGATIDLSAAGYLGGTSSHPEGFAPVGVTPASLKGGGGHGGPGSPVGSGGGGYDGVFAPSLGGGGGARQSGSAATGMPGGGALLVRALSIELDGSVWARGASTAATATTVGAGAGGAVYLEADQLSGNGTVDVSGGDAVSATSTEPGGAGGGGRVAYRVGELLGFDPEAQTVARGGRQATSATTLLYGAPGTLLVADGAALFGRLVINNGEDSQGNDRRAEPAVLPALWGGAVTALLPQGGDAWISSTQPIGAEWLGVVVLLEDSDEAVLGSFQVINRDSSGRLLLAGAGAVVGAATFFGEYHFDSVTLKNGSGFFAEDRVVVAGAVSGENGGALDTFDLSAGTLTLTGSGVPFRLVSVVAEEISLSAGAVVTAASGSTLSLTTNRLSMGAGTALDMNGRGYESDLFGGQPPGLELPELGTGGSHGGAGSVSDFGGPAGPVFDSLFVPDFPGGGGSFHPGGSNLTATLFEKNFGGATGNGGGVILLELGELEMAAGSAIRACGDARSLAPKSAAGAGGTVRIHAGTISGAGVIDVSGGDAVFSLAGDDVGGGGGGRVAITLATPNGSNPPLAVKADGGLRQQGSTPLSRAAPGTIYVRHLGEALGDLVVRHQGPATPVPGVTQLPRLGSGEVFEVEPHFGQPADLWIAREDAPFDLGMVGMVVRINGLDFTVIGQRPDLSHILLAGAAGLVEVGDSFVGVYQLDTVTVEGGAVLELRDLSEIGTLVVGPGSGVLTP